MPSLRILFPDTLPEESVGIIHTHLPLTYLPTPYRVKKMKK